MCCEADPVTCVQPGCGVTLKKWKSFRQHLFRKHHEVYPILNEVTEHIENDQLNHDPIMIHNESFEDEGHLDRGQKLTLEETTERLQLHAAQFLVNIREKYKISHTAIEHVIDGQEIQNTMDPNTKLVNFQDIKKIYTEKHPPSLLFSTVQSKKALDKVLIQKFNMVSAERHALGTKLVWKKKKHSTGKVAEICETTYDAYIVPFLKNLKNLLENDEVRSNIENPKPHEPGVYRTVLDGSYYRENPIFRNNNNALAVILYYDDLGIANPLGAASKSQKLSVFYWTLGNIYPEFRSSKNAIQLYAILKTEYLKKPGILKKVLESFMKDIVILENEGVTINLGTETKIFKGSLLFCAGDTPASALLGGFKESVSAYRFCRSCLTAAEEYKTQFHDDNFTTRNKTMHNDHCEIVSDPTLTMAAKKFWQKTYGVMNKSPLLQSSNVDVTLCLPQDCMHILIEGPVEITIRRLLRYCIFELRLFTIEQFNKRITHFDYSHFKKDKPALILRDHLVDGGCLRQSAAQIFTLAHMLPFLISDWIQHENPLLNEHINCYITLLQIMNVCLAYEIHEESIELLNRMIETSVTPVF
ncbi:PREDICTED: uncharacterized protein LOC108759276 [Trachymyrmex cornetzi]|uniref:uncharacterized protein LOC108759276 n=1 Tax=Trachymyrmex cornetzi TaxID=471704 RepID=UPI00084F081F|nr:PREDICTED: uncharacterized protein LOC108759276 [Trachymyrmex cornetzi]